MKCIKEWITPKTNERHEQMLEELAEMYLDSANEIYEKESKATFVNVDCKKMGQLHEMLTANYHNLLLFSESIQDFPEG